MNTPYTFNVTKNLEVEYTHDEELRTPEELLIDTIENVFDMDYENAEKYALYLKNLTFEYMEVCNE